MIQGPPDPGTGLSQTELLALAREADRGDEAALDVYVDVLVARGELRVLMTSGEWSAADQAVTLRNMRTAALRRARDQRRGACEVISLIVENKSADGLRVWMDRALSVVCASTGRVYQLAEALTLYGGEMRWAEFEAIDAIGPLPHPTKLSCADRDVSVHPEAPVEGSIRVIEARITFDRAAERVVPEPEPEWRFPTYDYPRERLGETRGFRNTPLALRAKLKPWER